MKTRYLISLAALVLFFNRFAFADTEPDNNTIAGADTISLGEAVSGTESYFTGDGDWYVIHTYEDGVIHASLSFDPSPQYCPSISFYNSQGYALGQSVSGCDDFSAESYFLQAGTWYILIQMGAAQGNTYAFLCTLVLQPAESNDTEPDNSATEANPLSLNSSTQGHILYRSDVGDFDAYDYFKIQLPQQGNLCAVLSYTGSAPTLMLSLINSDGVSTILTNTDYPTATISINNLASGVYYLEVSERPIGSNGIAGGYTLSSVFTPACSLQPASGIYNEEYYLHEEDYPANQSVFWGNDSALTNGITHDDNNWYVTTLGANILGMPSGDWNINKIPVETDLVSGSYSISKRKSDYHVLDNIGYDHAGDLDHFNYSGTDYLIVPFEKISETYGPAIAIFRCSNLKFIAYAVVPFISDGIGWCAVSPADGCLYASNDAADSIFKYYIDWNQLKTNNILALTFLNKFPLKDACGEGMTYHDMQGGEFTPSGKLLYINTGIISCFCKHPIYANDGLHVFDATTWQEVQHSVSNTIVTDYSCVACTIRTPQTGCFDYTFDNSGCSGEEPEGLTIWDLDDGRAPNVRGQLHVISYNHEVIDFNAVFLKNYSKLKAPDNLNTTNITSIKAKLNWNIYTYAIGYKVRYREVGTTTWTNNTVTGNVGYKKVSGLTANTQYEWEVRTKCSTDPNTFSEWSSKSVFTTSLRIGASAEEEIALTIFPNPASDNLFVSSTSSIQKIIIQDLYGRTLLEKNFSWEGYSNAEIKVSTLSSGPYIVIAFTNKSKMTKMFMKM